jgi:hypothetical protein
VCANILDQFRDLLAPRNFHQRLEPSLEGVGRKIVASDSEEIVRPSVSAHQACVVAQGLDPPGKPAEGELGPG